jgi:cardiolipin synthase (CMP-forming)
VSELRDDGRGWLTVPNGISVVRLLALTPLFVVALVGWRSPVAALVILVVLGVTDWVDGLIARRFHQRSAVGAKLDPVADRVSQGIVCITTGAVGLVPWPVVVGMVLADLWFAGVVVVRRPRFVPVSRLGRARTAVLMVAFPAVLLAAALAERAPVLMPIAVGAVVLGAVMHVIADVTYSVWILRGTEARHADAHPDAG